MINATCKSVLSCLCTTAAIIGISLLFMTTELHSQGFESVSNLIPFAVTKNSGERTQSKIWKYDGKWWSVFPITSGTYVWRLDGTSWTNVLKISSSSITKADCKTDNDVCHILLWREFGYPSQLVSVEYDPSTKNYKLWSERPSTASINLDAGVETATIDIDAAGRMWLASDGIDDIRARWSDPPYATWSAPIIIESGVTHDDIGTVISLPLQGQVGIFWSNQNTQRFGFRTHDNGASPGYWSKDEVPASQSALNIRNGMADDHIDLALTSDGTLYCAIKTGYDTQGYPRIALLRRQPNRVWDDLYEVSDTGTKPIVIISEVTNKIKVIFPSASGSDILYKESPLPNISFGSARTLLSGSYDNATSTKDNYDQEIVVLATDVINKTIAGVLGTDIPVAIPPAPKLFTPANLSSDQRSDVSLGWEHTQNATSYRLQVSETPDFSNLFLERSNITSNAAQLENLSVGSQYYWRVLASNSMGNSAWSETWSFTVTSTSAVPGLAGYWKLDEGTGTTIFDDSGNGNNGQSKGFPSWTTGVSGSALTFNGLNQHVTIPDNPSLDITGEITLTAWIRPEKIAAQKIITKGDSKIADGYELSLLSTGKVSLKVNQYSSDTCKINSRTLYPIDGTWVHIAGTFNGTEMKIYINGTEDKKLTFSLPVGITMNTLPLNFGASTGETNNFKGAIDEVRIFNYALTDSEIYDLASGSADKMNETARLAQ